MTENKETYELFGIALCLAQLGGIGYNVFFGQLLQGGNYSTETILYIFTLFVFALFSIICLNQRWSEWRVVHPIFIFVTAVINIVQNTDPQFGYVAYILGVLVLYVYGYLNSGFIIKVVSLVVAFFGSIGLSIFINPSPIEHFKYRFATLFFFSAYGVFIFILFNKQISGMARPMLKLEKYNISETDTIILKLLNKKYTTKEIAIEMGIAPRTVDTHISQKLLPVFSCKTRAELMQLLGGYRLE